MCIEVSFGHEVLEPSLLPAHVEHAIRHLGKRANLNNQAVDTVRTR